ncbi:MAG TPA: DUF2971 domain-containing protein [Patescibacteria group bacterium]|nr:DUF2971 domain-containing protein [Patescibacteria group bacterium]
MCEINSPDNTIFHYCSVDSFFNIIKSKSFRLGDIEKSNDSLEKKLVINAIIKLLSEELEKTTDQIIRNAIRETQKIVQVHDLHSYVCCFSEERDFLSQWRGYADEAYGMAIGVDKSKVDIEIPRYNFFKVSYDSKEMEDDCRRIINEAMADTMPIFHLGSAENLFINLQERLWSIYLKYKNSAFKYENEWRIVANGGFMYQIYDNRRLVISIESPEMPEGNIENIRFSKLQHCVINKQVRSYIDLIFEDVRNSFIKEIWLGPKCKNTEEDVHILLSESGYDVETMYSNRFRVHTSSASYR